MRDKSRIQNTLKKRKADLYISSSCDLHHRQEFSPRDVKIILSRVSSPRPLLLPHFQDSIQKQNLLESKGLFNPFKYFGSDCFDSIKEASKFHASRLQRMFVQDSQSLNKINSLPKRESKDHEATQTEAPDMPSIPENRIIRESGKTLKCNSKNSISESQYAQKRRMDNGRGVSKSPKRQVQDNKENYMRMNMNVMQKMRVKLKLSKK